LELRGSTAFLAHDGIEISKTWREEILAHLKSCQALIAVVTPNFEKSTYANQEAGITLGRGKPVISPNFTKELPGFLESIQAVHVSEANLGAAVERAIKVIHGREPTVYIEPAFKSTQEVEDIAIDELKRHIRRTVKDSDRHTFGFNPQNLTVTLISLNEEKGVFDVSGKISSYVHYESNETYWHWSMVIDARSGKIIGKSVAQVHPTKF